MNQPSGQGATRHRLVPIAVIGVVVVGVVVVVVATRLLGLWPGSEGTDRAKQLAAAIDRLRAESTIPVQVSIGDGFPQAILARVPTDGATPEERARDFVNDHRDLYGLASSSDLHVDHVLAAGSQASAVVFQQRLKDVPVHGAQLSVPINGNEALGSTGRLIPPPGLDVTPSISAADAEAAASAGQPSGLVLSGTTLTVFDPAVLGLDPRPARLAWLVRVAGTAIEQVFIDARDGSVVERIDLAPSALGLDLASANNETSALASGCYIAPKGTMVGTEAGIDPAYAGDREAADALAFAGSTYQFFVDHFQRESFDGAGTRLRMFIHARFLDDDGFASGNAHWIGGPCGLLEFSDGFVADDVVTHEFSHGVVEHTAGLEYVWQSGALNESYADVFAFLHTGDPVMGEGLPDGAIRDLSRPAIFEHPDRFSEIRRPVYSGGRLIDSGWVHYNSGIPNHAAYLLARGGTHSDTGISVAGIGDDRTAALYFVSLSFLNASSDLIQQRVALEQAALALAAPPPEVCSLRNALAAVEIGVGDAECDGQLDPGDGDGDMVIDRIDNCPTAANADQRDVDRDGSGDACDDGTDRGPDSDYGIRIVNLWARPETPGQPVALVVDEDEPPLLTTGYTEISEFIQPPLGDTGGPAFLYLYPAIDIENQSGHEIGVIGAGQRVTLLVQGFNLEPWPRLIWEHGIADPPPVSGVHIAAWPAAPADRALLLLDPGPLTDFGGIGIRDWWYGIDGECLRNATTGELIDREIGGYQEWRFVVVEPGQHEITASRSACNGAAVFSARFEIAAGEHVGVFPHATNLDDLAFTVLPMGRE